MQSELSRAGRGSEWGSATQRGVALFLGGFALVNILGELCRPGFDLNLWWVDLRFLPAGWAAVFVFAGTVSLLTFALSPPRSVCRGSFIAFVTGLLALVALVNSVEFYLLLAGGQIHAQVPVPLSLLIAAALAWIALAVVPVAKRSAPGALLALLTQSLGKTAIANSPRRKGVALLGLAGGFLMCVAVFPVLQMVFFGKTDYRRPAHAIIVPGARVYANGQLSEALADRVRTAANLYQHGLAGKVIFSGGPGEGLIHETDAMRSFAIQLGVKGEDILLDTAGLNTQATVDNTERLLRSIQASRVLVVSQFYHLPRLKMAYHRAGREVYTVPVREPLQWLHPYNLLREVPAQWVYYLRPLKAAT